MPTTDMSARVRWIRAHSGLTWRELGRMFGTSQHAVHMWATGGRANAATIERLERLEGIIRDIELDYLRAGMVDADLPDNIYDVFMCDLVRKRLFMQRPDAIGGTSIVDEFRREATPSGPTWGAPFPPEYLVGAIR
jgi:transcriptional regulator with XRE-family HTH domain